jgi:hypothetical protein
MKRIFAFATAHVRQRPETRQSLPRDGTAVSNSRSPEDFAAFLREQAKIRASIVRASGAKSD